MFSNYIKLAWRNLRKNTVFSAINIIGLATGISFTLIIGAYVWSEYGVNRHLKNSDRQYIIQSKWKESNQGIELTTLGGLAKALKESYPNLVENYYRWDGITSTITKGDKAFREGIQICDSTMLNMYGFKLIHGDPATVFDGTYSVLLSKEKAIKYFGKTDVVGETITVESFSGTKKDFRISGVLADMARNSVTHINSNNNNQVYIPVSNLSFFGRIMDWNTQYIVSYIELKPNVKPQDLLMPMQDLVNLNAPPILANNLTPFLVPLKHYHLNANNGMVRKTIYSLAGIAFFILLMAVINFVNMSISQASKRMREIGIRKVMGGLKRQLVIQFLTESVLLVLIATSISLLIYIAAADLFGTMLGMEIPGLSQFPLYYTGFLLAFIIILGTIAGIYPAFVLSSLKSVESLKGKIGSIKENIWLRKSLVALQFGTATIVFAGAIVISKQISLFFEKDLGYNRDYILTVQAPRDWTPAGTRKLESIRRQFTSLAVVKNASISYEAMDGNNGSTIGLYKPGTDSTTAINSQLLMADEYFASTFSLPLQSGEFFSNPGAFRDSSKIVINEEQAKALGWTPQQAIGQKLLINGSAGFELYVAGVVSNFHFESLGKAISPITFMHVNLTNTWRQLNFKLQPGSVSQSVAALQQKWNQVMPGIPFEYKFIDDNLKRIYTTELQLKQASYTATVLSMIIVLLGVLGLIALSLHRRTREIGIRKVLGSSVPAIIGLFVKEFVLVIFISGLIATPIAWLIMQQWLNDYVYRIDLDAIPFILSVVLIGMVTSALIILQTMKAANANPVTSLRSE